MKTVMFFDSPPSTPGVHHTEAQEWLNATWPTLTPEVVQGFLHWERPWSALLCGGPETGKTLLLRAFSVLCGGVRYGHGREPGEGAKRRLRVRDGKLPSLEFLLYGQRAMHAIPMHDGRFGSVEVPFVGYGRALATTHEQPPDAWRGLSPSLHILQAVGGGPVDAGMTILMLAQHLAHHGRSNGD